jgi:hypothetical protein
VRLFPVFVGLLILVLAPVANATPAPVRVTGNTTANDELLHDTLNNLTQFAPTFDCDRISTVDTHVFPPDSIPRYASYRVDRDKVSYERWTANFCGKFVKFMVIYITDPEGGTFIKIEYPYPRDAL